MERYAPHAKDLASRDVVSRAIVTEMREGRGCGPNRDHVLLQLHHLDSEMIKQAAAGNPRHGPDLRRCGHVRGRRCRCFRPPTTPWAAFRPTASARWSRRSTRVRRNPCPGLYAAGECACVSVHGGNRLGGNSLLDIIVFGRAAGNRIIEYLQRKPLPPAVPRTRPGTGAATTGSAGSSGGDGESVDSLRRELTAGHGRPLRRVPHPEQVLSAGIEKMLALEQRLQDVRLTRSQPGIQYRAHRGAGTGEPDGRGHRDHHVGAASARKAAARIRASIFPSATTSTGCVTACITSAAAASTTSRYARSR